MKILLLVACWLFAAVCRAGALEASVKDADNKPLADAVVYLQRADGTPIPIPPDQLGVIDQINKDFVPRTIAVTVGSRVRFPNKDNIHHHVYSFSAAKKFELPLYEGTPAEPVLFDAPGVVTLGCNIHDWMRGYIVVLATPLFAVTGSDGMARIDNVPEGSYQAMAWHARAKSGEARVGETVQLPAEGSAKARFVLELKPELRVRRAPTSRSDRY